MKRMGKLFLGLVLASLAVSRCFALYAVTDLGVLSELTGRSDATVNTVNVFGKAVGMSATNGSYMAFINGGARTNLGTLGGSGSTASGINVSNVVIGGAGTTNNVIHAYKWVPGATGGVPGNPQMFDLGTLPGDDQSDAYDVNQSGQVAGVSYNNFGGILAVRFNTNGTITDIGTILSTNNGMPYSYAYGVNQQGQVVGTAYDQNFNQMVGFFYNGTSCTLIGDFTGGGSGGGNTSSEGFAINNNGQITGYAATGGGNTHAFRRNGGFLTDLGTLGGSSSAGTSINNSNVIVGVSSTVGDAVEHAFICTNNTMVDLNNQLDSTGTGWLLVRAEYISDNGYIVGFGTNNNTLHGFLLTPIPGVAPSFTNNPQSQVVLITSNATFSALATGTAPLVYRWQHANTNLSATATNTTLTLTNAKATDAGTYRLIVTNSYGSATSSVATLTVVGYPNLNSVTVVPPNVVLNFNSSTGATYYVENRTNLSVGGWSNAVSSISGSNGTTTVTNVSGGTASNRFYRVRVTVP